MGVWGPGFRVWDFYAFGFNIVGAGFFRVAQSADVLPDLIVRYVRESQEP